MRTLIRKDCAGAEKVAVGVDVSSARTFQAARKPIVEALTQRRDALVDRSVDLGSEPRVY